MVKEDYAEDDEVEDDYVEDDDDDEDEEDEDEDDKMRWRMVMVSWPNLCTRCLSKVFWQDLFMRSL